MDKNRTAILALVVSVVALGFSVFQYFDGRARDEQLRRSKLNIHIKPSRANDYRLIGDAESGLVLRTVFDVTVTNIGFVPEGVIGWLFYEADPSLRGELYLREHHMPKLIDANGQEVAFPIQIPAHETKVFKLMIGLKLDRTTNMSDLSPAKTGKPFGCAEILKINQNQLLKAISQFNKPVKQDLGLSGHGGPLKFGLHSEVNGWQYTNFSLNPAECFDSSSPHSVKIPH